MLEPEFREFVIQGIELTTNDMIDGDSTPIKEGIKKFGIKVPSEWYSGQFVGSIDMIATREFRRKYGRAMNQEESEEYVDLVANNTQRIREHFSKYDLI